MQVDTIDLGLPHITPTEMIGRGGFSVVYKAIDTKLNRHVAVKVLTSFVDQADLDRFDQECRIHGPLSNHPNIVTIYDAGFTPIGHPFLVMEYLGQGSLVDHLARNGPMNWSQAVAAMVPICDAVEAAHRKGILHRDIKPANILLSTDGPKLADFGIACGSDATSPQFAVSWLHAPLEAELNQRDERSDVYSLASTMYELLTGHAPYWREGDESLAALFRRMVEEPVPNLDPSIAPSWLNAVLQRALAKDAALRPASAAELSAALTAGPSQAATTVRHAVPVPATPNTLVGTLPGGGQHPNTQHFNTQHFNTQHFNTQHFNTQHFNTQHTGGHQNTHALAESASQLNVHPFVAGQPAQYQGHVPRRSRSKKISAAAAIVALAVVGFFLSPAWAAVQPDDSQQGEGDGETSSSTTASTAPARTTSTSPSEASTTDTTDEPDPSTTETSTTDTTEAPDSSTTETTKPTTTSSSTSSSSTPRPVRTAEVPNVAGLTREQATATLNDEGFTNISLTTRSSSTVASGLAIGTDPTGGTEHEFDSAVTIAMSSGAATVRMPNVDLLQAGDARSQLEAIGLTVSVTIVDVDADSGLDGAVVGTNPASGTDVAVGSNVTLQVGKAPAPAPIITIPPVIQVPTITIPSTTLGLVGP